MKVYAFISQDSDKDVASIKIEDPYFEYEFIKPICITKIDKKAKSDYFVGFTEGPSGDPSFEFYKIENGEYKYKFGLPGLQVYIPGNGNIYTSGIVNNMFDVKAKFRFENDNVQEVSQPFYYVGFETKTLEHIKLYSDKSFSRVVATLPPNSEIELIAAETNSDRTKHYFLIKTSFGLLGWWELDDFFSKKIEGLYFRGD